MTTSRQALYGPPKHCHKCGAEMVEVENKYASFNRNTGERLRRVQCPERIRLQAQHDELIAAHEYKGIDAISREMTRHDEADEQLGGGWEVWYAW